MHSHNSTSANKRLEAAEPMQPRACRRRRTASFAACAASIALLLGNTMPGMASTDETVLCPDMSERMQEDFDIAITVESVFRDGYRFADEADGSQQCVEAIKVLQYADFGVLLTSNTLVSWTPRAPQELSAYTLVAPANPAFDGPDVGAAFPAFDALDGALDPDSITAASFDGRDAFTISRSITLQGYSQTYLSLYVFEGDKLVPAAPILIGGDNGGALEDESDIVSVEASYILNEPSPGSITLDFEVTRHGVERQQRATMTLDGAEWVLTSGELPAELDEFAF